MDKVHLFHQLFKACNEFSFSPDKKIFTSVYSIHCNKHLVLPWLIRMSKADVSTVTICLRIIVTIS